MEGLANVQNRTLDTPLNDLVISVASQTEEELN